MILFAVGPYTFAISAAEVDEIKDTHELKKTKSGFTSSPVHNTVIRGNKEYAVVDSAYHFRMLPSKSSRLLILRNHQVAVAADSIDRMTEIAAIYALPPEFRGEERNWYKGLAVLNGEVVPVVNAAAFGASAQNAIQKGAAS